MPLSSRSVLAIRPRTALAVAPRERAQRTSLGEQWQLLRRALSAASDNDVTLIGGGLAFYAVLGLFPSLLAVISIYGMVANPGDVQSVTQEGLRALPPQAQAVVDAGIRDFVTRSPEHLGIGAVVGLLVVFWSAASGMEALVSAINRAYRIPKRRGFFARTGMASLMTLAAMLAVMVCVPVVTALPRVLRLLHIEWGVALLRWPVIGAVVFSILTVLYRQAPDRRTRAKFRYIGPGAAVATTLWLVATGAYSLYFGEFASLASTYGALEGVVVLLMWMLMSSIIVLLGAEFNAELERTLSAGAQHRPTGAPSPALAARSLENQL